ncbi:nuclear transport factor 2 family protein [Nocardioides bruguierae]|uniref:Nuclear transport factor 2 family protein n=1 Tax=Nocardioides bruguierae TaxID=2945102 RepID=A0A9X2D8Q6_9ACTN|nr:nuclear transport factor 2 family protein [Nocardioides bruguierae]MCM0621418.1 nuclear transport factor 2 family protein [Nocardioides bruguierae]
MTTSPSFVGFTSGAAARHEVANLLHTYVGIADARDVGAGVALLGDARVVFPAGGFDRREDASAFLAGLWGSVVGHRHDVHNLVVEPAVGPDGQPEPGRWRAHATYTRWMIDGAPRLHTLGEYDLVVAEDPWRIEELVVTRTWTE